VPLLVQKFGGTSVATAERIKAAARRAIRARRAGNQVVVVVSARGDTTDDLLELAGEISTRPAARELDMLLSTGEQVSIALMSMAIQELGAPAISFTGAQVGIVTDSTHGKARIRNISTQRIRTALGEGTIVVVAGFQGIDEEWNITTLGRGGSDTTAVALAAVLKHDSAGTPPVSFPVGCEIYTDVDGVYTTDPRVVPRAQRLEKIAFEEMLEMASLGAKVMQVRSIELGMVHNVRIFVRSSFDKPEDIDPMSNHPPGTLICDESEIMEQQVVTGIAFSKDEAQISIRQVPDKPGVAAAIFGPLAEANVNVDMIVQIISADGKTTDLTFTVPASEYGRANAVIAKAREAIGYDHVDTSTDVAKVSVIGIGMRSHAGVAAKAFKALSERQINIRAITTSEIKFSLLIDAAYTELAVRTLHSLYGLDK
jgi:aspartate kinase